MSQKDYLEILLPWISLITKYYNEKQIEGTDFKLGLNSISNLIECLLLLLNDNSEGGITES